MVKRLIYWSFFGLICTWGVDLRGQDITACGPEEPIAFDEITPASDSIDVVEDEEIADLDVSNDISHTWISDMDILVTSPGGTTLVLFTASGGSADNILVTWDDGGVAHGSDIFACDCAMQPDPDEGALDVYNGEFSGGLWTLDVIDFVPDDNGTLNEWCVLITEVAGPQSPFRRGDVNGNGVVLALIDAIALLDYSFNEGPVPACLDAADIDGDNVIEGIEDTLALLNYAYNGGEAPATPGPFICDLDDDMDGTLDCGDPTCGP